MFATLSKLTVLTLSSWLHTYPYEVFHIPSEHFHDPLINKELASFEQAFTYPFSTEEHFHIQHGIDGNYFEFFERLGKPYYYVAVCTQEGKIQKTAPSGKTLEIEHHRGEIAAAGCGVLRTIPTRSGKTIPAWYICDLKVKASYQGERLPLFILQQVALGRLMQCPRGYGICMNPRVGEPKAAVIFKKHGPFGRLQTQTLNLYTLSAAAAEKNSSLIQAALTTLGYATHDQHVVFRSTHGAKDYLITNEETDQNYPWKLFHLQLSNDPSAALFENGKADEDGTYMLCAVEGTELNQALKKICDAPTSTAQIVSYGMEEVDFNFLTSNQI